MNIDPRLHKQVDDHPYPLLFVTISGAHLYGSTQVTKAAGPSLVFLSVIFLSVIFLSPLYQWLEAKRP